MTDAAAVYRAVSSTHRRCFWLDRLDPRGWSMSGSMIGWLDEDDVSLTYDAASGTVTRHTERSAQVIGTDIFRALEDEIATGPSDALWVGYLGYASRTDLPARTGGHLPDAVWMGARHLTRVDGATTTGRSPDGEHDEVDPDVVDEAEYAAAFDRVQEHLRAGNSYEVNLTYRTDRRCGTTPTEVYLALRRLSPAPYSGVLQHDVASARTWLLSSSPERFARVDEHRVLETRPIKGTTPRGPTEAEDAAQAHRLATDPKFRAENLMIVDLMRNDVGRVCEPGSVTVPGLMEVESYANVHQLVSTVRGVLRPEVTTLAALHSLFPPGSMTGAPKLRTMQIIEEVEDSPRGPYAGAFGWISPDGTADLGVVIRSLFTDGAGTWTLGTGGGILARSEMADELDESRLKASRLLASLAPER